MQCIEMLQIPDVLNQHRILDIAAGTGTFSLTIASDCIKTTDSSLLATDVSPGMVEIMRLKAAKDIKPEIRSCMSFAVMDGQNLEVPSNSISHLACVFGIMFFPDRMQGLREMHRVLQPSATAAIAVWESVNMPLLMEHIAVAEGRVAPDQLPLPFTKAVLSYTDSGDLTRDLIAAGFPERAIAIRTVERELVLPADAILRALAINPAFEAFGIPPDAVRRRLAAHPDAAGPDHFAVRGTAHIALARKAAPA
jgi:SAM-dependent methyltransferase